MAEVGTLITPPGRKRLRAAQLGLVADGYEPTVGLLVPEESRERFQVDSSAAAAAAFHDDVGMAAEQFVLHFIEAGDVLISAMPCRSGPSPPAGTKSRPGGTSSRPGS